MTVLDPSIDILCAPLSDPRHPTQTAASRAVDATPESTCSRRAMVETIGLLASMHDGLHRDENGTWWTGDWALRIATTQDRGRWLLLNEIARALGFEA